MNDEVKIIVNYTTFEDLKTQNQEMLNLIVKIYNERDIENIKQIIREYNYKTRNLWV